MGSGKRKKTGDQGRKEGKEINLPEDLFMLMMMIIVR